MLRDVWLRFFRRAHRTEQAAMPRYTPTSTLLWGSPCGFFFGRLYPWGPLRESPHCPISQTTLVAYPKSETRGERGAPTCYGSDPFLRESSEPWPRLDCLD